MPEPEKLTGRAPGGGLFADRLAAVGGGARAFLQAIYQAGKHPLSCRADKHGQRGVRYAGHRPACASR